MFLYFFYFSAQPALLFLSPFSRRPFPPPPLVLPELLPDRADPVRGRGVAAVGRRRRHAQHAGSQDGGHPADAHRGAARRRVSEWGRKNILFFQFDLSRILSNESHFQSFNLN